jgi:hypothetical protein
MNKKIVLASILVLSIASLPAAAQTVTIDPNNYAPGTNLTNAVPGVTLWLLQEAPSVSDSNPAILSPLFSTSCSPAPAGTPRGCASPTGNSVFGHQTTQAPYFVSQVSFFSPCYGLGCADGGIARPNGGSGEGYVTAFRVDFLQPVSSVEVIGGSDCGGPCDGPTLAAYNSSFQMIGECFGASFNPATTPAGDCAQLVMSPSYYSMTVSTGADDISYLVVDGAFNVDSVTYTSVRAPDTACLFLTGLGGLWLVRIRRRPVGAAMSRAAYV